MKPNFPSLSKPDLDPNKHYDLPHLVSIPAAENTSLPTLPQNTQNSKPELEPQVQDGAPLTIEIDAIVGIAAVVASTVLVMRCRLLKASL